MAYVSHRLGETRLFDCLYDPSFILSGCRDILKANSNAMAMSTPIQILSRYNLMFSNIPKIQRQITWKEPTPLPHFRLRAGYDNKKYDVKGRARANYFYHPINVNIINLCFKTYAEPVVIPEVIEKNHNIGCQTNYRESSVQTCPYQPDAIIHSDEPENLDIILAAKLIHGLNKPGDLEAEIVERARKRRKWEKNLVKLTSEQNIKHYRAVLEAFEWEEWIAREDEIEALQNMRMKIVERLFEKRDNDFKISEQMKLERCKQNIVDKRKKEMKQVMTKYASDLRKLDYKHKNVVRKYRKESISSQYSNPASDLYGPQMRFGFNPKRKHYVGYKEKFESRLDDLDKKIQQQSTGLHCPFANDNFLAQPKQLPKEYQVGFCNDKGLQKLYKSLQFLRLKSVAKKGTPKCLTEKLLIINSYEAVKRVIVGIEIDNRREAEYQCCIYLQKIIKGRAIQNMIFSGKEEFNGLIEEINSTYTLKAVEKMFPDRVKQKTEKQFKALSRQRRIERIIKNKKEVKKVFEDFEGSTIGWLLEFYEKELDRLYEQKKVQALCMLAEAERFKRESIEAGKRQKENKRRAEHQETYNSITKTTRDTISLYLENLLIEESDLQASSDARAQIQQVAQRLDHIAEISTKTNFRLSIRSVRYDETNIISDIVNNFVFPEVQKCIARKKMEKRQKRHLLAAHEILYSSINQAYPKPTDEETNPEDEIPYSILNQLINTIPKSSPSEQFNIFDPITEHPVQTIIQKLIKNVIPSQRWKSESEVIVRGTISDIIKEVIPTDDKTERLNLILSELESKLWKK